MSTAVRTVDAVKVYGAGDTDLSALDDRMPDPAAERVLDRMRLLSQSEDGVNSLGGNGTWTHRCASVAGCSSRRPTRPAPAPSRCRLSS
ncbi:hypothetical protein [Streptomyces sp. HUAS TT7]|uniref:hypothetical protein n=1 Tax=Streptomyces sp. HUAS TT7 TaxID=3447507 RepID=UPI003F65EAD3